MSRDCMESAIPIQARTIHNAQVDVMLRQHQVGTMGNNRNYPRFKNKWATTMGIEPRPFTRNGRVVRD